MFTSRSIQSSLSLREKLYSIDFVLVISILVLGIVSMFAMYSTAGGIYDYHTKSHIMRFGIFFVLFFIISFIEIKFWYQTSTLLYLSFFIH